MWDFLRRTSPVQMPLGTAHLHFYGNETRPRMSERMSTDNAAYAAERPLAERMAQQWLAGSSIRGGGGGAGGAAGANKLLPLALTKTRPNSRLPPKL